MINAPLLLVVMLAQNFEQRGFIENHTLVYPQTTDNDSGHVVSEELLRWEASYKFTPWLTVAGAFDARTDTHRQVERAWSLAAADERHVAQRERHCGNRTPVHPLGQGRYLESHRSLRS
jgi:hypothetical protein